MLRNGSDGVRRNVDAGALGADGGTTADGPAELICADHTPSNRARAKHHPTGPATPHPNHVTPDHSAALDLATAHPTSSLLRPDDDAAVDHHNTERSAAVTHASPTGDQRASGDLATPHPSGPLSLIRLSAAALAGLGRGELLSVLSDIERLTNRLDGYRAEVLGALDALNQSGAAPDASPHLSLRDAAGVSERDARRMLRAAEKTREHETVLEALSDGDINAAQAETLCDARVPEPVRAKLVAAAAGEDTDATRRRVQRAETEHSVENSMERFERQRAARGAGWRRDHEGMLRLWAKFDPDTGAQVEAALEALCREYWNDDKQVRNGRRTPAQRDADVLAYALAGLTYTDADAAAVRRLHARASTRSDNLPGDPPPSRRRSRSNLRDDPPPSRRTTPRNGSAERTTAECEQPDNDAPEANAVDDEGLTFGRQLPPAQISVLIGLDALRGQTDEMGLTDAGVGLPPEIVRRMACDAEIIPIILGSPGGAADAGRSRRTVPLRLRRLLIARDRHCRWPGCHEPPSRCDAHHIWHWIDGGPTNLDNLVLLCHRHHHFLHQHGHKMVPQPDGTWTTVQETEPKPTPRRGKRRARAP